MIFLRAGSLLVHTTVSPGCMWISATLNPSFPRMSIPISCIVFTGRIGSGFGGSGLGSLYTTLPVIGEPEVATPFGRSI